MNFGQALELIKKGEKLSSKEALGNGAFVYLVHGSEFEVSRAPLNAIYEMGKRIKYRPHIDLKTADGTCGVWVITNEAVLAEDWEVVIGVTCMNCNSEINGHGSKCDPCLERLSNG